MNKVQLIGRLTKDVECQEYGNGKEKGYFVRFALAIRDGVDWNTAAVNLERYTKKGDQVAVIGRITENNYEDKDKVKHYTQQVTVSEIELLSNKRADEEAEEDEKPAKSSKKYHR